MASSLGQSINDLAGENPHKAQEISQYLLASTQADNYPQQWIPVVIAGVYLLSELVDKGMAAWDAYQIAKAIDEGDYDKARELGIEAGVGYTVEATLGAIPFSYLAAKAGVRSTRNADGVVDVTKGTVPSSLFDDLAAGAARNPNSDKVVLGKFLEDGKSYTRVGAHYDATYFKLDNWRDLSKTMSQEDMWKINESFLRQQITQGKEIILSHDPVKATGFFAREVDYLESLGYTFKKENWIWKATR